MGLATLNTTPDVSKDCWVRTVAGKNVRIVISCSSMARSDFIIIGRVLRIDQFGYRYYLVVTLQSESDLKDGEKPMEKHINIDHIMMIEEVL